tara:strand:+ start:770 stop:1207 length:438 start_codon:yes stop_codon:yes gene_type:complete
MQYKKNIHNIPLFEGFCRQNEVDGKEITASIDGTLAILKLATTENTISKGFGDSPKPKKDNGMLFVHKEDKVLQYWMKNVDYDLDILYFDSNMKLVKSITMKACGNTPEKDLLRYSSEKPARFAVEMRGGWCKDNEITSNARLKI